MPVFHVLRESEAQNRLDAAAGGGLTPLVDREQEVALLLERWRRVKDGQGQVVLLNGEAGIGKSRLVQVVKERVTGELHSRVELRGSPYHQQSPLYPVIARLHRMLGWHQEDSHQEKLRKLEDLLSRYGFSLPDAVPLFAALLALPSPDHYPPLAMAPQRQKEKTLEALLVWLRHETERQPVLYIVEDLHWLDPSTLEFLSLIVDQAPTMRVFVLLTCRPTFRPPWTSHAHLAQLALRRLPRHQAALMIAQVTGGKTLPAEVRQQLLTRTDGVPLFVEELTKMVLESEWFQQWENRDVWSTGSLPALAIPATLQDSLMARLDRLGTGKLVAQLGATIGRRFSYELLRAVSPMDEGTLRQALGRLVEAELLYQSGMPPHATYLFKHALIQEIAHQSLLRSTRQQYHQQIAQVLAERFAEAIDTEPELLAYHYTEAGRAAQAVPYWLRAGQDAIERSANVEAISHLSKGLEVLKTLPASPERVQHELALYLTLGPPLLTIKGQESPEVADVYNRALALCQQVGDSRQRFSALRGLASFYNAQGRLQTSRELTEQSLALAQDVRDPELLHGAYVMLGSILVCLGELVAARTHLEQGLALRSQRPHRAVFLARGSDSEVVGATWLAWTLWMLGYPDQALAESRKALHLAEALSHSYSLAFAHFFAALLHLCRRDPQSVHQHLDAAMALSEEHGFVRWLAGGRMVRGWALAEQGAAAEGIGQLKEGLAAWRAMGGELALPHYLSMLAEAYGKAGQAGDGLRAVAEAQALMRKNAEHRFEAELWRLQGELLWQQASPGESGEIIPVDTAMTAEVEWQGATQVLPLPDAAEHCFSQALQVAHSQQAKTLELRAATSLACLWQAQRKRVEAHQMLAEVYGWFKEGFDTPDLREAKACLDT
jgi:predicted ATPase